MKRKKGVGDGMGAASNSRRRRVSNPLRAVSGLWTLRVLLALAVMIVAVAPAPSGAAKKRKPVPKNVQGLVLDSADNPLAGAAVEMKDVQTGKTIAIYADSAGNYQFTDLDRDHDYEIRAKYNNLASEIHKVSSFDNRNTIPMNLTLEPAP